MQEMTEEFRLCVDQPEVGEVPVDTDTRLSTKLKQWQTLAPLISTALAAVSVWVGGLYTAHQARQTQEDYDASEWRSAVSKVSFDEQSAISSAFQLESFEKSAAHGETALKIEVELLARTGQPEMFDVIYWDMVGDKTAGNKKSRASAALDLGRSLRQQLYTEYELATRTRTGSAKPTFAKFVQNPAPYLRGENRKRAARTFVLLYELDTFSDSVECMWGSGKNPNCPRLDDSGFDFSDVQLINHSLPKLPDHMLPPMLPACKVRHVLGEVEYECL